jgi:hypothetical protein
MVKTTVMQEQQSFCHVRRHAKKRLVIKGCIDSSGAFKRMKQRTTLEALSNDEKVVCAWSTRHAVKLNNVAETQFNEALNLAVVLQFGGAESSRHGGALFGSGSLDNFDGDRVAIVLTAEDRAKRALT